MRQTQKVTPKSINVTLTFSFLNDINHLVLLKGVARCFTPASQVPLMFCGGKGTNKRAKYKRKSFFFLFPSESTFDR